VTLRAKLGRLLGRGGHQKWHTRSHPVRGRRRALREEIGYWDHWLATRGGRWPADYARRLDADAPIADDALRDVLKDMPKHQVSIVDVGAGPVSSVGYRFPGKEISLLAIDPLGREFDRLLARHGVTPPVRTTAVAGESLLTHFGADRFDIAYARNALDHSVDPVPIIKNMLAVARPGGHVVLRHKRNEAVRQGYVQLHQWNFDHRDGRAVVWRPDSEFEVASALPSGASLHSRLEPGDGPDDEWMVWTITKAPEMTGP
jgi:SAM-dependent methyltransferase